MNSEEKEKVLGLLCDKFVYGLGNEEAKELDRLGYHPDEAASIERTVAVLGLIDLDAEAAMPTSLHSKLMSDAAHHFGIEESSPMPSRQIVFDRGPRRGWFDWLGWAVAAAACVALAISLLIPRNLEVAGPSATPTPSPEERLTPAQQREKLMALPGTLMIAEWAKGKMQDVNVTGDVVWSPEKQAGYMRLSGLPKNDPKRESYQLWIVDDSQDKPIDGGTFDVTADGEIVIPIDAKLKSMNPKLFAITVEKPGGVVVSKMEKFAAQAHVKLGSV